MSDPPLRLGAWFALPESVARVAKQYDKRSERPVVLLGDPVHVRVLWLARSTKDWGGGRPHEKHDGRCGRPSPPCRLDEDGWIRDRPETAPPAEFTAERFSCEEPSDPDDVLEWLFDQAQRAQNTRRRR